MDVRDLLSSEDDTSPLSAPDLHLLIDRLQIRSLQIKTQVQKYLETHSPYFQQTLQSAQLSLSQSAQLSLSLSHLLSQPQHPLIQTTLSQILQTLKESKEKRQLLCVVSSIARSQDCHARVQRDLLSGSLLAAAQSIRDMKCLFPFPQEGEPLVYGLLRNQWNDSFSEIQGVLIKSMENAVQFEKEHNRIRVRSQLTVNEIYSVELGTVLEAMGIVGILDYGLAKVTDLTIKHAIIPAVNLQYPVSFVPGSNETSNQMRETTLSIVPSFDHQIEDMDGGPVFSKIIEIVKFIYKFICLQNISWFQTFGKLAWPRISELIISNYISKVVPDDASKLADFQKIIKQTSEFESILKEMMFIAADNNDKALSNFAENVEVHFASRKKIEILAKARNMLLHCDFALPQEYLRNGSKLTNAGMSDIISDRVADFLYSSEKFVVSEVALQLMDVVHQTLQDVCVSTTRVGLEFYHAARDALLLYEVVIPVKLERQLDSVNHVAVLMYNDCLFLSQEILGLAFQYRSNFPISIKEHTIFVDLAPRFQLMAAEILQKQILHVTNNLNEAINGADGFQNTHIMQQYESAKFSIDQVVFVIEKVRIIWEPLLLPSTYKRSMSIVLESVFSRMAKDVLLLDDIAADETLQLQRLINLMLEQLLSILDSLVGTNHQNKFQDGSNDSLSALLPSLCKVRKLADMLDMPLKFVTTTWESGELDCCGFTLKEVEDFIKSIFTDSPLRKECLWRIKNVKF